MKLTALIEIKLSKNNPAPPVLRTITIELRNRVQLSTEFTRRLEQLKKEFKNHSYFNVLSVYEEKKDLLMNLLIPSTELEKDA